MIQDEKAGKIFQCGRNVVSSEEREKGGAGGKRQREGEKEREGGETQRE